MRYPPISTFSLLPRRTRRRDFCALTTEFISKNARFAGRTPGRRSSHGEPVQRYAAHVSGATRTVHEHIAQPYLQANMGKACLIVLARHVAGACAAGYVTEAWYVRHTQRWGLCLKLRQKATFIFGVYPALPHSLSFSSQGAV